MFELKYMLPALVGLVFVSAVTVLAVDLYLSGASRERREARGSMRWRTSVALAIVAWAPLMFTFALLQLSGVAGCR